MDNVKVLAQKLWEARRDGEVVDPADLTPPTNDAEAYAVQDEIVRLSGYAARGFKVGSTSAEAQAFLGTTEPGSCPLLAPYLFESPATIQLTPAHMPALEGEFAFLLGRDLPARGSAYSEAEVRDAIYGLAGAIEVVGTRLKGGLHGKGRHLVTADSGANIALVVGDWLHDWRRIDLKTLKAEMRVNGVTKGSGTGARALGDPMNVMVWLANQQAQRGSGLKAGDVVSTGTCTGLDPVQPGDQVAAHFGGLGVVDVQFN